MMPRLITLCLPPVAPGNRSYASAILRNSSGYQVPHTNNYRDRRLPPRPRQSLYSRHPTSPFYLCKHPSTSSTCEQSFFSGLGLRRTYGDVVEQIIERNPHYISAHLTRTLVENKILIPKHNLFQKQESPKKLENTKSKNIGESECISISSSDPLSSDVSSSFPDIEDPFLRERGDTFVSDFNSEDISTSISGITMYTGSSVEFNGSSIEGSHSSDLVPVLSPCVRLSFSSARSSDFSATSSARCASPSIIPPVVSSPSIPLLSRCTALSTLPLLPTHYDPYAWPLVRPPPITPYRPRGRFYNPRFDPLHPLFERDLLLSRPGVSLSPPQDLEKDDTPSPIADQSGPPELDSDLDTNAYSSWPVPGQWPDSDTEVEPSSGRVGWLKAITTPAVALIGVIVAVGLCAAQFVKFF